jgi:hypothetical protein
MVGTLFHPGGVTPPGGGTEQPHNLPFFVTLGQLKNS